MALKTEVYGNHWSYNLAITGDANGRVWKMIKDFMADSISEIWKIWNL